MLSARPVIRGNCFALHFSACRYGNDARLGLVIPKRLAKAASLRNAIKRQAREVFRLHAGKIAAVDVVLRLSKPLKNVLARDVEQRSVWRLEIQALLERLGDRPK